MYTFHIDYFFLLFVDFSSRTIYMNTLARCQLFRSISVCRFLPLISLFFFFSPYLFPPSSSPLSLSLQEISSICMLRCRYAFIIIVSYFLIFCESSEIISFFLSIFSVLFIHGFIKLCAQMCLNKRLAGNVTKLRIVTEYSRNECPSC